MISDVVVIGGGLAGLSAAVRVSAAGGRVALFEQSQRLGGRCSSHRDARTGETVDNGQHVLLGSYRELLSYLGAIGSEGFLRSERSLSLPFHHPDDGLAVFRLPVLPAPFDLTAGVLRYRHLDAAQKAGLLRAGAWLRSWGRGKERELSALTVGRWLDTLGQDRRARECFWDPIAVSVMNELPERAAALPFARAMRRAFLERGADSRLLIPKVGQTELYVDGAVRFLDSRGSTVRRRTGVASVQTSRGSARGVVLRDGTKVAAGRVIAAVPPWALPGLLPGGAGMEEVAGAAQRAGWSPIVSVTLWFDRSFMEETMVGLIGRRVQWAFNRREILAEGGKGGSVACVISAAREEVEKAPAELAALAVSELRSVYPKARAAALVHSSVIKERRATHSPTPEAEAARPGAQTGVAGFYLAGDWTATGLPATIEGAVASGHLAAALALG